ncbi:MAG: restriction endonuclease subunit S [Bacteroidales bacterium]|nr:restriction endonuclease subunit S [Bacteroidales bacterium]
MNQMDYKRLGDYIRPVDVRNKDLKVNLSQGICNAKYFQNPKQVADNPETHKVVRTGQFAYNRATTRNGEKISIALREGPDCTVSSAYQVFEIIDENLLNPKYLMMWFKRPEFDRLAIFYSHGSAHEFFEWDAMCEVRLPVPTLARQREIVSEYETLTRRIRLNEQMIARLEETAQALYRKMFVDGIDKENLPEGWCLGKLGEISEINSGKTCSDKVDVKDEKNKYPVAGASGIIGYSSTYNYDEKLMTTGRVGTLGVVNRYNQPMYMADNVLVLRSKYYEYCYQILTGLDYSEITKGGVQSLITQTDLKESAIMIPPKDLLDSFEQQSSSIYSFVETKKQENLKLTELQSLILARMGKVK